MGEQEKLNEFGPATDEAWMALVQRDLKGAPFEKKLVRKQAGLTVKPLYTRADSSPDEAGLPGAAPFTRGRSAAGSSTGWDVRQQVRAAKPEAAAEAIRQELSGGATSLLLRFDAKIRGANDFAGDGIAALDLPELETVLAPLDLASHAIQLDAGVSSLAASAALFKAAEARGVPFEALSGTLGFDPLGTLASFGQLGGSLDACFAEMAEVAHHCQKRAPRLRAIVVNTSPYHEAGANAAQEVAIALATGVTYLRALTKAGLSIDDACRQLLFSFSIGRDLFFEVAKLRAARGAWSQVIKACGGTDEAAAMTIHALSSSRTQSTRDPWVNLLRGTAETFAAIVGGADAITTVSFDAELGESDPFSRRMARNTQHILREESNLHRVTDPGGGSWYIESVTRDLCEEAWKQFQAFEAAGGIDQSLLAGKLQAELAQAEQREAEAVASRKLQLTGINEFPFVGEEPVVRPRPEAPFIAERTAKAGAKPKTSGQELRFEPGSCLSDAIEAVSRGAAWPAVSKAVARGPRTEATPLTRSRLSHPFERLRAAADEHEKRSGSRPTAFLANLGPIPSHKARAAYAQNYLEAGGFAVLTNDGFKAPESAAQAFAESGASIAVICGSDEQYGELAEATGRALRDKQAKAIVLAGKPGDREASYRGAGIDVFIYMGTNLVSCLEGLLKHAGASV